MYIEFANSRYSSIFICYSFTVRCVLYIHLIFEYKNCNFEFANSLFMIVYIIWIRSNLIRCSILSFQTHFPITYTCIIQPVCNHQLGLQCKINCTTYTSKYMVICILSLQTLDILQFSFAIHLLSDAFCTCTWYLNTKI